MTEAERTEAKQRYAQAVFEEQRARCIALSPEGHWTLSGGFRVRPLTARDLGILDEICPPSVRGGRMTARDYTLLLWHMRYPRTEYRWKWIERRAQKRHAWRVSLWLRCSDLARDADQWMAIQCQDIGGGSGSGRKEYASAAVVLATVAAGTGNPIPLLDVPLITLGQILKVRDAQQGAPVGNKSDELRTPEVLADAVKTQGEST